ncbi:hypothetical protein [Amycolatopsis sp. NPDC004625]|uniref:hypothetical protein n=1 Tax=Amycolatopsis sp. NPDC004625 TaxID=3154670 RepID=UPI0033BE133F
MSARQPLFGMLTYRPRHARPHWRWQPVVVLPATAAVIGIADTPTGATVFGVTAALGAGFGLLRWRWLRAAARLEEIIETELAVRETPGAAGSPEL